jgi:hypothetical protein
MATDRLTAAHVAGEADFLGWANQVDTGLQTLLNPTDTALPSYFLTCSVDQVLTNVVSPALTPITELTENLPGDGGIWIASYVINYTADSTNKATFDMQGPSDADPLGQILGNNATAANDAAGTKNMAFTTFGTSGPYSGFASAAANALRMSCRVIMGSTTGDVGPRFKQTTSGTGTNTTILAGSFAALVRVQ